MKKSILISASLAILALSACDNTKPPVTDGTTVAVNPTTTNNTGGNTTTNNTGGNTTTTTTTTDKGTQSQPRPANSLCNANEKVMFNCKMENGNKTLSVCASENLQDSNSYVQYRYGTDPYTIDMRHPKDLRVSKTAFQLSSQGLSFNTGGSIRYQVFAQGSKAGVKTFWAKAPNKNRTLPCKGTITNNLDQLNGVLN